MDADGRWLMMQLARRATLFVTFSLLTLTATTAKADAGQTTPSCVYLHHARPERAYAFAQATLIGLSYMREAVRETEAFEAERKTERNPQTLLIAMMRHTKMASDAYACAEMVLEPYKKSHDKEVIGRTADLVAA